MTALAILDYCAVFVFALSGAFAASRAQLDLVGFIFLASLTALGGGTTRDLLLDRAIFWMVDPSYLAVAASAAVVVFWTAHLADNRLIWLVWLDAFALAVAVPAGVVAAQAFFQPWPIVILMGILTGTFGGLLRDVVVNDVPVVLAKGELYVTAAFAGGGAALIAFAVSDDMRVAVAVCGAVTLILRAGSLWFGWHLPVYKSRPPRNF
ncbi:Uncharacterized membrane protein YeiH [Palleronia salina]|uniref:Uncharacterized membrane protein YeiH n=1 Tax=Palleronia salina TaxID=313368 RepID=A0A1M6GW11_9RHOB|nr:TRIC cation channel family protein [Palleronia salina]SHJ14147.1 Uncharacterized membrane protein YeiH [Palleronia salina]